MLTDKLTRRLLWLAEGLLLVGAFVAAAHLSRTEEWGPLPLVVLLLVLALIAEQFDFSIRGQHLSASFIALMLTMALLGPAPAVAFGLAAMILNSSVRKLSAPLWLNNLATYAVFPLVGGLLVRALIGNVHAPVNRQLTQSVSFALVVFGVYMVTLALNFVLVALDVKITEGRSFVGQVRDGFIPLLPGHIALGTFAAILAIAYTNLGLSLLFGSILVLLAFQYLMRALVRSEDRADQLEARSIHLASLQLGVLSTLVETLSLRDRNTARHAAAVSRLARALAEEIGCDEAEQDLIHTAGLLHDIGKFALPDRILHAEILSDDDWAVIRRHPQDGATLVGRLDGYGPVAEAILYHHEHVDGSGYPAGLIGNEIPRASRILAICSTYDTLTARESYRSSMTPQDAMKELRRVAGRQLDAELVESLIALLEREGALTSATGDQAEFDAELAFERRARSFAQPAVGRA
jgi:putative nucleotidyltransferase with HDIG domain